MKALVVMMLVVSFAQACPQGCIEWEGNCACDAQPHKAPDVEVASDEKPRKEQQPEWEVGDVKADLPPSLVAEDLKLDAEKLAADAEGKRNAGIK